MKLEIDTFIERYVSELRENNVAIFAGAGMSSSAGYVDWRELLRPLARELGVDIDKEHDLVSLAQYHCNDNGRHSINQRLLSEIATTKDVTTNHKILARLPIATYWTTNYDKLIERSLSDSGKIADVKYTNNQLATTLPNRDAIVYKMHGDIDHPDTAIITKDDYEKYSNLHAPYVTALSGDLVSKTFLFIGFSFTDPNLDYIMSRIRIAFEDHQRQHYCIFRKCSRNDYQNDDEYSQADLKQSLVINDLKRFKIKVLLVDEYSEITEILLRIEKKLKRSTIFISGSASDFSPWNRSDVESFLCKIGSVLVEQNFKIVSGVGLGVGNAVITGAIESIYNIHHGNINDYLHMRPFPQFINDDQKRKAVWSKYRHDLIGSAGIALFFLGNKEENGNNILANGMREEFEIAHKLGLSVIPIGSTGFMAKELWGEVVSNISIYYPPPNDKILNLIKALGEEIDDLNQLISKVIDVINYLTKE